MGLVRRQGQKKRARTAESNMGPDGEAEMEAAEAACKRSVKFS